MSTYELLDELEAGELSVQYEGEEPQALLEWAIEEFSPRIAISAAFQADDVALIDMAYKIDPKVRIFTVDTGRLPRETHELIDAAARAATRVSTSTCSSPTPARSQRLVASEGPRPDEGVGREPAALLQRAQGAAADEASRRARRLDHRPAPRPVGDAHEHPQGRDRPRPRRDREAEPAGGVDEARGVGLPRARTTCRCTRSMRRATRRSAARRARARSAPGEDDRAGRWWWETNAPKECGMHCSIENGGFEHELNAILGKDAAAGH